MQTKIILSQVLSKIAELKQQISDFESSETPSQELADELHQLLNQTNKLVSAYSVLLNHKSVSPQVDIHLKVMEAAEKNHTETNVSKPQEAIKEPEIQSKQVQSAQPDLNTEKVELSSEPIASMNNEEIVEQKMEELVSANYPKIAININDKFRFISELFKTNSNEYHIAVEQINACQSWNEAQVYLSNLQSIYQWDLDSEMVKRLFQLTQKRFS
jgi:hypothetical protein